MERAAHIDVLIINDGEARALGKTTNLVKVAKKIRARAEASDRQAR